MSAQTCPVCDGSGLLEVPNKTCTRCDGTGIVPWPNVIRGGEYSSANCIAAISNNCRCSACSNVAPKFAGPSEFDKFAVASADLVGVVECRRVKRAGGFWWQFTIKTPDGVTTEEIRAGLWSWLK